MISWQIQAAAVAGFTSVAFVCGWNLGAGKERARNIAAQLAALEAAGEVEAVADTAASQIEASATRATAELAKQDIAAISQNIRLERELRTIRRELNNAINKSENTCAGEPVDVGVRLQLDKYHARLDGDQGARGGDLAGDTFRITREAEARD